MLSREFNHVNSLNWRLPDDAVWRSWRTGMRPHDHEIWQNQVQQANPRLAQAAICSDTLGDQWCRKFQQWQANVPKAIHIIRNWRLQLQLYDFGAAVVHEMCWLPPDSHTGLALRKIIPALPQKGFGDYLFSFHVDLTQPWLNWTWLNLIYLNLTYLY